MAARLQPDVVHVCAPPLRGSVPHCVTPSRIPLGLVASLVLGVVWVSPYLEQPGVAWDGYGVVVFGLAAVVELTAEPLWVMAQLQQYVSLKVCSPVILASAVIFI